jgi:hypothetical protein
MAVTIPIVASLALGAGAIATMGWYITGQIDEIAKQNATLEQLKSEGGAIQLSHCGEEERLCVKIDLEGPTWGNRETGVYPWMTPEGY